jgi:metal-sulfur cluster biosynthetic enzyme
MTDQHAAPVVDEETVHRALRQVKDPEAGLNIIDLGLVYDVEIAQGKVTVTMTLTSPGCPAGGQIMSEADEAVRALEGVDDVRIELVWEPYWTPERIDPKVRAYLGF